MKLKSAYGAISFPKTLVLNSVAGVGVNQLFMNAAIGLLPELGAVTPGPTSQEFDVQGPVTIDAVKEYLKSYALIVQQIKYSSSNALQLNFPIKYVRVGIDEEILPTKIEIATEKSEDAFNDKLITVSKTPFVLDNQTGLTVGTAAGYEVTLAMTILAAIPYGNLEKFLNDTPIPMLGKNC